MPRAFVPAIVIVFVCACGSAPRAFDPAAASADGGAPPVSGSGDGGGSGPNGSFEGGVGPANDCTDENKQIYVVSNEDTLYRFDPLANAITKIGTIACNAGSAHPFSMGVDRRGTAWVLFDDGRIHHVSTKDASCTPTQFKPGQHGFSRFGMAFVAESPGSSKETLFVANYDGDGIGSIDTTTLALSFVGPYDGFAAPGELTGTGAARMFAFFTAKDPIKWPRIAEIDPKRGKILDQKGLMGTEIGDGWAFAHWGGDFWLFTAPGGSSEITRYSWQQESTSTVKRNLGYVIVGAGVSTCAPTSPPK